MDILLPLVLMIAAAVGIALWWRRFEGARREAFEALAARRGWSLSIGAQTLGRPATLRLSSRGGPVWQAIVRSPAAANGRMTEFSADEPHWADGYLVAMATPPADPDDTSPAAPAVDAARTGAERLGADLNGLVAIDAPPGLTVLASTDPTRRVDLSDLARLMTGADLGGAGDPVVLLGPDGLRMRLDRALRNADQAEAFIDLAQAIARTTG